ncbi:hypothetical protein NHX12_018851 [Muraenolepis orangiensis]|uniref:VHS domain-containing protein n=1 Tax=Muraenolepis orangiensis TaxID=630683 RepID=A0A9Q0IYR3_9TELE|nr:hypothetical protein NHX12_018851 [Muraenolepis orangiensis]
MGIVNIPGRQKPPLGALSDGTSPTNPGAAGLVGDVLPVESVCISVTHKATDPNNVEDRWDCIQGFYQLVNRETDGPQIATRLLAFKISFGKEKEVLQALTILEVCMHNCGRRFHVEVGQIRFLNELLKLVIPKDVEGRTTLLREGLDRIARKEGGVVQPSEEEDGEEEELKVLYERCDRLRPSLFRLASETTDDSAGLAAILAANDQLSLAMAGYKPRATHEKKNSDTPTVDGLEDRPVSIPNPTQDTQNAYSKDMLLVSRGLQMNDEGQDRHGRDGADHRPPAQSGSGGACRSVEDPDDWSFVQAAVSRQTFRSEMAFGSQFQGNSEGARPKRTNVPMEVIRPGLNPPLTVSGLAGLHISLHFARDTPVRRPSVAVMLLSVINTTVFPVTNFLFQAAVPKCMSISLQPPTSSELSPYNPPRPPPTISQVILVTNPKKDKMQLRFKLELLHGDRPIRETGELENFPPWSALIDV